MIRAQVKWKHGAWKVTVDGVLYGAFKSWKPAVRFAHTLTAQLRRVL